MAGQPTRYVCSVKLILSNVTNAVSGHTVYAWIYL